MQDNGMYQLGSLAINSIPTSLGLVSGLPGGYADLVASLHLRHGWRLKNEYCWIQILHNVR